MEGIPWWLENLPANAGGAGLILGPKDPLEKQTATTPVFLPEKIPWTEEPGGLQSMELHKDRLKTFQG